MKALRRLGAVGLVLLSTVALTVALSGETGPEPVTGSASLGTFNRYIFRGYRLGRDSIVFEPALSVSYRGFSATFWGNVDMREKATPCFAPDRPGRKSFNETDLTLSYTHSLGRFGLDGRFHLLWNEIYGRNAGALCRSQPGRPGEAVPDDLPGHRRVSGDLFPFVPGPFRGLEKGDNPRPGRVGRLFFGVGRLLEDLPAERRKLRGEKYRAFHDGMIKAGLTFALAKNLGLQAGTQFCFPLSAAARRTIDGHSYNINGHLASVLVFGTTLTFSF